MVKLLGETVWQFFKKLNMLLKYDSSDPLLGQYPKEMKVCVHTKVCPRMSITALFVRAKSWKSHKCPSEDKQINVRWNMVKLLEENIGSTL